MLATLPSEAEPTFEHRLAADGGTEADRATLARVRQAMRRNRKVRLTYRGSSDEESSARVVCPYLSAFATGAWYLVADCERSNGIRVFRVDRIEAVEALDEAYQIPPDFWPEDVFRNGRVFQGQAP
ncbi:MAG TPA: WYL domain-containing protein, partial [Gemmatimonadales bacterium]|nr:WYL domain-containing protein [Gemmatimonadales bacterium]